MTNPHTLDDPSKIGLCMTCGNRFLFGVSIDDDPRTCCTQTFDDGSSSIVVYDIDEVDEIRSLIMSTRKIAVIMPPQPDVLCGMCQLNYPTTWIFNNPYRDDERLCDACVARYNQALWANEDPRALFPRHEYATA